MTSPTDPDTVEASRNLHLSSFASYEGFYDKHGAARVLGIHPESLLRSLRVRTVKGRRKEPTRQLTIYVGRAHRTHRKFYFDIDATDRLAARERALRS